MRTENRSVRAAMVLVVGGAVATSAHAATWIEPRSNDAGNLIEAALYPGPELQGEVIDAIAGVLDVFGGFGPGGLMADPQDLFAIDIVSPSTFSARTVFGPGEPSIDTQLFLFSAAGLGQLANDDFATFDVHPRLTPMADDGTFTLTAPGLYFLGIAGKGNNPVSGTTSLIFNYGIPTELSGPDGAGGTNPLTGWVGPETLGAYRIELTGVRGVPTPGAAGLGLLVIVAGAVRRRR
jgi:hypothetical protein